MTFRKSILLLISLSTIAALLACGGGSSHTTIISPPPPPPTPPLPDGSYVFSLSGTNSNNYSPYYVVGAFTIAGGAITGGEQDFTGFSLPIVDADLFDGINPTGSSVTAATDGNLKITLVTCTGTCPSAPDPNIGPAGNGTEILSGTILPNSATNRTFINEFDAFGSASGELDTQSSTAALSGGYAFVLSGGDGQDDPLAVGGIIDVSGPGTISFANSIFDINDDGDTLQGGTFASPSSVTATPDAFGKVTFALNPANATHIQSFNMIGYTVDANRIFLLESANDNLIGTESGIALSQSGTVTNGGFTAANAAGAYVIGFNGFDTNFDVFQLANQLTLSTTAPDVTGFIDFNDLVVSSLGAVQDTVTAAAYTVDASGDGDVTIPQITDHYGNVYSIQLYLDGNGHALGISMDPTLVIAGVGFTQGAGPFTATSFNGAYGLDVTGGDFNYDGEFDGVGPVKAVGSSGTLSGDLDLNWLNLQVVPLEAANSTLTGTFAPSANPAAATAGVFTGTVTGIDLTNCPAFTSGAPGCTADAFSYYLIDATGDNIAIETDLNQATLGVFAQQ